MDLKKLPSAAFIAASLLGAGALAADAGSPRSASTAAADEELEAVTVSARRREEELQDVPLPVSVVDGDTLDQSGSFNIQRLQQLQPALQFYTTNPRNSAANIRGFGAPFGLTNDGIEQGVGQYVDDVYYARAAASTLDFLDVERLEVLRGPQGTLYGKNTTAGAINITTRKPTFTPEGIAEVTVGNLGFYQLKSSLSGPLVEDKLAGRIAVSATNRHGTITNVATGTRINEQDNIGLRGQLLWQASDNLDVTLAADYNKQNAECCGQLYVRYGSTQRSTARQYPGLSNLIDTDTVTPGIQPYRPPSTNPFDRLTDIDAELSARSELGGVALRAVWNLGAGTLTSVSAWRYWDWLPANDRDFTGVKVWTKVNNPTAQDQVTQEFRYSFTGERVDYVVGLFGYRQVVHTDGIQTAGSQASRWLLNPSGVEAPLAADPSVLNGLTSLNDIDFKNTSAALFGQLSWKVTDKFRVEPGVRLNYDDKDGSYVSTVINGQGQVLPVNPADPFYTSTTPYITPAGAASTIGAVHTAQRGQLAPLSYNPKFDDWNISGGLTLAHEFTADVLGYATYGRSFKTGGINLNAVPADSSGNALLALATVKPETVNHYELGLKTQFLDRSATLNLSAFRTDVKNYQATVNNGQALVTRGYLANAEKVRVQGGEVEFSYSPSESWNAYVNGAYTDHEYAKFTGAPCPPELSGNSTTYAPGDPRIAAPGVPGPSAQYCDISGQWLPGVSKLTGSWGFQYQHPASLLGRQGEAYFAYDGYARSRWSSHPSRSAYADVGGYGLANFRLGIRSGSSWDVYAWIKNAFDKQYFQELNAATGGNTGLVTGIPADPRTWGLTVRAEF